MKAYMFHAALWCPDCTRELLYDHDWVAPDFDRSNHNTADALESLWAEKGFLSETDYDSDEYPKGPYGNGGGEADCPQHCDSCGVFLENPLTDAGDEYVRAAVEEMSAPGTSDDTWEDAARRIEAMGSTPQGNGPTVAEWIRFYLAPGQ